MEEKDSTKSLVLHKILLKEGKSVLKVIPTCSVWEIRAKYRSQNNKYFSFTKYNEVERRLFEEY